MPHPLRFPRYRGTETPNLGEEFLDSLANDIKTTQNNNETHISVRSMCKNNLHHFKAEDSNSS